MSKSNSFFLFRRIPVVLRVLAGLSVVLAILFITVTTEMFEHGAVFTFLGYISVIISIIGLIGGILVLIAPSCEFCVTIIQSFCLIGLIFIIFYSAVSNEFEPGLSIMVVFWLFALVYFNLPPVRRFIRNEESKPSLSLPPGKYFRANAVLPIYLIGTVVLLILIWVFDWEAQAKIYSEPNGGGISSYVNEDKHPAITVNVDGGFIYNVSEISTSESEYPFDDHVFSDTICGEIIVKLTDPSGAITLYPHETGILRLCVLNMPKNAALIRVPDEMLSVMNLSEPRWSGEQEIRQISEQILAGRHLTLANGCYYDLDIVAGKPITLEVVPYQEDSKYDSFRFAVMSDLHSGYNIFVPEFKNTLAFDPDFVIINGDFTNLGYPSEYMVASATTESWPLPVYSTIGNHDAWNGGSTTYNKYYGPFVYSFVYKNATFIFLDSSSGIIGQNQFEWLINELEKSTSEFLFVVSHMPPIDTVTGSFDTSNTLHPESLHTIHSKSESDYLLRLMAQYDVDVFFAGHTHIHGQKEIEGTTYITSGVLGGTVKPGNDVCYLQVEVESDHYSIETIDILSAEEAGSKELETRFQAVRVFGIPFLINNSVRIAASLFLLVIVGLVWIPIRQRLLYRINNLANNDLDTFVDRQNNGGEDDVR
ncbi:MAG: metallophosphoesterase [Clostridiales bacterium]|nr:metallophosphoesterase [Clostridiales bacterium]